LLQFDNQHVGGRCTDVFADVCLFRRPQNLPRLELPRQDSPVRKGQDPFERAQRLEDKGRVPMLLRPVAGLVLVVQHPDMVILQQN